MSEEQDNLDAIDKKNEFNLKHKSDLTLQQKIQFYIASGGKAILQGLMRAAFIKYYTDTIGLKGSTMAIIYIVFTIWAALNDPIIGIWLDRQPYKKGKGKYRPFFMRSIPFWVLMSIAFPWASPSWSQVGIAIYFFFALTLWETALTLFSVAYECIAINLFITTDERTQVEVIDNYIGALSVVGGAIPIMVLGLDVSNTMILVFLGLISLLGGIIMAISIPVVREKEEFYIHEEGQEQITLRELFGEIWQLLKDKTFLIYFVTFICLQRVASSYILGLAYFYDNLMLSSGFWTGFPDIFIGLLGLILFPFIARWIRKYGSKKVVMRMMLISLIGYVILFFVPGPEGDELKTWNVLGLNIPGASYWIGTLVWCVVYVGFCAIYTTNGPIQKRLIDYLELKTGDRRPGTVKGIIGVLMTPGETIYVSLFLLILSKYNYDGESKIQTPDAQLGIRIATAIMPAILIVIGLLFFSRYPIDKITDDKIEADIVKIHGPNND